MEDKELSFWDHLDVLRWSLARVIAVWLVLAIGFFIAMPYLFENVILAPCHKDFFFYDVLRSLGSIMPGQDSFLAGPAEDIRLQSINVAAPFFIHLTTSFILSIVVSVPYLLWEIWRFVRPALYENEYKGMRKALLLGSVMFFIGVAVGYFMVFPLAFWFLSSYNLSPDLITNEINLNSYIDTLMTLTLCMGLAFELPLVTWILSLMGLLTRDMLRKYRRHAVVVIVILAAVITPTGDPFTLTAVALPLWLLYEFSIFMVKERKEEDDDEDDGGDDDHPTGLVKSDNPTPGGSGTPSEPKQVEQKAPAQIEQKTPAQIEQKEDIAETLRRQREAAEAAKQEAAQKAATTVAAPLTAEAAAQAAEAAQNQAAASPTAGFMAYSDEEDDNEVFKDTGNEYWHEQNTDESPAEENMDSSAEPENAVPGEDSLEEASADDPSVPSSSHEAEPVVESEPAPEQEIKPEPEYTQKSGSVIDVSGFRYDVSRLKKS